MKFHAITEANYSQVSKIYEEGIKTGMATFQTAAVDWKTWDENHLPIGRITLQDSDIVLGWASLAHVSSRCVYGGVAEVSVYVSEKSRGKGIGKKLLLELIKISEAHKFWTLQSGIMRDNKASIQMHINCGFREIGYREKIGQLNGVWLDNILLERRSKTIGIK
ncbi:GNAT family N-acetyltransferase [Cellulophaga baltica]|uniref:GNAT family N-acetyltransferase n=1 Tax=Cellulophaga TaxID=104264 RepID=UPI001C070F36|nr:MULTISPECIES: GNAT family N-acetyltransferase [Cellulophaga]MBU2995868.1 GNAT family N-acetyltransferase [Cellulophaga baltica]MDO6767263.1 GNAT family N-acetyltransferase [Cellulophaga sp. 1_MG-2023]